MARRRKDPITGPANKDADLKLLEARATRGETKAADELQARAEGEDIDAAEALKKATRAGKLPKEYSDNADNIIGDYIEHQKPIDQADGSAYPGRVGASDPPDPSANPQKLTKKDRKQAVQAAYERSVAEGGNHEESLAEADSEWHNHPVSRAAGEHNSEQKSGKAAEEAAKNAKVKPDDSNFADNGGDLGMTRKEAGAVTRRNKAEKAGKESAQQKANRANARKSRPKKRKRKKPYFTPAADERAGSSRRNYGGGGTGRRSGTPNLGKPWANQPRDPRTGKWI